MTKKLRKPLSIILSLIMILSVFTIIPVTSASAAVGDVLSEDDYLTFTAEEAGSTVTLNVASGGNFQYNKNNSVWEYYSQGTQIALSNEGDSVRFRGTSTTFNSSRHFSITGKVACSGNVMSLRLDDGKVQGLTDYCFSFMFLDCTGLTQAPELPETELKDYCYAYMFYGCANLTEAPELPATNLATYCYSYMFSCCTSLTELPALPATTLAEYCYMGMFYDCESLTELPALPATTLAEGCYMGMFEGCTSICISDEAGTFGNITYSAEYRIPTTGEGTSADYALYNMFGNTGGKFTGTPDINTTYYVPAPAPTTYTVTWKNWDGTELETDTDVAEGETPVYDGETPEKYEGDGFIYTFAGWTDGTNNYSLTDELPGVTANVTYTATFDSEPAESTFYVVGSFTEWQTDDAYMLTKNAEAEGEYMLTGIELNKDDQLKVVETNESIQGFETKWYPDGTDTDYVIPADGVYDIYFRPYYDGGDDWYFNCIYVADVTPDPDQEAADEVAALIDALPAEVTLDDADDVADAKAAYDALTDDQKALVDDDTLLKLESALAMIEALEDQAAADAVADTINALPAEVTVDDKDTIEAARAAYEALTADQKALVDADVLAKLEVAEEALAAAEQAAADQAAADAVADTINALPTEVTVDDKDNIEAARAAYEALTADQKALVDADTLAKLEAAEEALAAAEQAAADQEAADAVIAAINDLPAADEVTVDDEVDILDARTAYNELSEVQQALVDANTLAKLEAAEEALAAAQQAAADQEAADAVIAAINDLPAADEVTVDDEVDILDARTAYNELSEAQQALVDANTLAKLVAAEEALAAAQQAAADQAAADEVAEMINTLPAQVTVDDKDAIEAARAAYEALTADQKALVDDGVLAKLVAAENALIPALVNESTLKNDVTAITIGNTVTVCGAASGGKGNYTYAVYYKQTSKAKWICQQDYSENSEVVIEPANATDYNICVKVKDERGTVARKYFTVSVTKPENTSTISAEEIVRGQTLTVSCSATGVGDYTYAVYYKQTSKKSWVCQQDYAPNSEVTITPSNLTDYDICVKAKDEQGTILKKNFKVSVKTFINTSVVSPEAVDLGSTFTVSCSAAGGSGSYKYAIYTRRPDQTSWSCQQGYSENATRVIKPSKAVEYEVCVKAKDSAGNLEKKYFTVSVTR